MNASPESSFSPVRSSVSIWKLILIGGIILALMIPLIWVRSLVDERFERSEKVKEEIAAKWGSEQTVSGPFLSVPYSVTVTRKDANGNDKVVSETRYLHITPDSANITGMVQSTVHKRGIFKVPGYRADLDIACSFSSAIDAGNIPKNAILDWKNALVTFDLGDERGLKELSGQLSGQPLKFKTSRDVVIVSGAVEPPLEHKSFFDVRSKTQPDKNINFKFEAKAPMQDSPIGNIINLQLSFTGTRQLRFLTSALQQSISLKGDWLSPSFSGDILPDIRTVDSNGFTAEWNTNYLNTGNKTSWNSDEPAIRLAGLGVKFLVMVDAYQQTTRTLKYAILFLLLTFMAFFFTETITRQRIHPIQYLMVGCSLIVFYLLLLSFSEHIGFGWSYLIAALAVVIQISLYSHTILRSRKFALQIGSLLTGVYVFLYVLLRLEDTALLVGSIGLFILLAVAMYIIRNVNWYNQE